MTHNTTQQAQGRLSWRPDPANPLTVWACWLDAPAHYWLSWGDGTPEQHLPSWSDPVKHTYAAPGTYTLTATAETGHTQLQQVQVNSPSPVIITGFDLTARVTLDASATQTVRLKISWPDWDSEIVHLEPGEHTEAPTLPGLRQVTVLDTDTGQTLARRVTVTDPQDIYGVFEVTKDGRTVSVRRTAPENHSGQTWQVRWGDEATSIPWSHPSPLPEGVATSHTYERAGRYWIEVSGQYMGTVYTRTRQVVIR